MGTLQYIINKLSEDDSSYTIDLLVDEVIKLEKQLDESHNCINKLHLKNKQLEEEIMRLNRIEFRVELG